MPKVTRFKDRNLQLIVLDGLWQQKLLTKPNLPKKPAAEKMNKKLLAEFLAIDLPDQALAKLERISYGGNAIHLMIWPGYSGETDDFDVRDFGGIERCVNLKKVLLDGCVAAADLSPLTSLTKLESLELAGSNPLPDVTPLLDLPSLKRLMVRRKKGAKNDKVIAALRKKGVEVEDMGIPLDLRKSR